MKIWIVSQTDEEGLNTGIAAFASPEGAVACVNEAIEEHNGNEYETPPLNKILYPVTNRTLKHQVGHYTYLIEPATLRK